MDIDVEKFDRWIKKTFHNYSCRGDEYCVDSIFKPDKKKKLWINPVKNMYRCWKTDQSGNVVKLVAKIDHISYHEAARKIAKNPAEVRHFESSLERLKEKVGQVQKEAKRRATLLPEEFLSFRDEREDDWYETCRDYILNRKLNPIKFGLGYCPSGDYEGCIIIPIYDSEGTLIYWTARVVNETNDGQRYRNPPADTFSITKEDAIWGGQDWAATGSVIFLTEGIFDAMALRLCGIPAFAILGKDLSNIQRELLLQKRYNVILAFDNDDGGRNAETTIFKDFTESGGTIIGAVRPEKYKDWNKALEVEGPDYIKSYIPNNIRQLDLSSRIQNMLSAL